MKPVIVIGKRVCSQPEIDALETVGYAIKELGRELHVAAAPGAPTHIADGYRAAGGDPAVHSAGLGQVDGDTICIVDDALATKLNARMPDWYARPNWIVLEGEDEVTGWASLMLTVLEEQGRSLVTQ